MKNMQVLAFNFEGVRHVCLGSVCTSLGLKLTFVRPESCGMTIGMLAGNVPPKPAVPAPAPKKEMLVLCGLDSAQTDRFLAAWRQTGQQPIRLKAVLTPTNASWLPVQLEMMLGAEAAAMGK